VVDGPAPRRPQGFLGRSGSRNSARLPDFGTLFAGTPEQGAITKREIGPFAETLSLLEQ
jgi:hypothetical protein